MDTANYGIYALILTIAALLTMIIYGPFTQAFIKFHHNYLEIGKIDLFNSFFYRQINKASFILLIFFIIFAISINFFFKFSSAFIIFFSSIYIFGLKISEFFNAHLNLLRKRKENSILQGVEKFFLVLAFWLLSIYGYLNLLNVLVLFSINTTIFLILKKWYLSKIILFSDGSDTEKLLPEFREIKQKIILYMLPFIIWGIGGWAQLNGEKWILAKYLSTVDVGIYAVMMSLINLFVVIPNNIISDFFTPIIFSRFSDITKITKIEEGIKLINLTGLIVSAFTLISIVLTYFFGTELLLIISNINYTKYAFLLPIISLGIGFFYIGQAFCFVGMALNKPQKYLFPKISAGILSVVLNIILINKFGINGVAVSTLFTGLFYLVLIKIINRKLLYCIKTL